MKLLKRTEIEQLLSEYQHVLRSGATHDEYLAFYREHPGVYRLEFPTGELLNSSIAGFVWAWNMKHKIELALPITGEEGFNAQGLEGKCTINTDVGGALMTWCELPEHRIAIYH